jgi:NDP-sugar pyrophosphorylase family protein
MRPRTERLPKILLDVAGKPFVGWLLPRLAECGFEEVILCVGHLGDLVRDAVGDGSSFGVRVRFVDEGAQLRGTGGALALARARGVLDDAFLVTYGDSYLPFDYAAPLDALRAHDEWDAVMAVYRNEGRWDASNVELSADGTTVVRYVKGVSDAALNHIDYGATAMRAKVLDAFPREAPFGLDSIQTALAKSGRMGAHVASERFFEIGSPEGLADLERRLTTRAR